LDSRAQKDTDTDSTLYDASWLFVQQSRDITRSCLPGLFQIGRSMANAHVIAMGLQWYLNDGIQTWFRQFHDQPPIPLTAVKVDTYPQNHATDTFERLLTRVVASPQTNFVLIVHGYEDGSGLTLPLTDRRGSARALYTNLQRLMDLDDPTVSFTDNDRNHLGLGLQDVRRLLDLMHKVWNKNIGCIEFRACNLGRNPLSLGTFRQFFGARRLGAPDLWSFFGSGPAVVGQKLLATHRAGHTGGTWVTYQFPYALVDPPHLVCCFQLDQNNKPAGGHVAADTIQTLDAWIKTYLMPAGSPPNGAMAIHGLWIAGQGQIILQPDEVNNPLGTWGGVTPRQVILPQTDFYRKHIVYSS
jgi:hypothetical protein